MDRYALFESDTISASCLVMLRMGGLRHVLLYLNDMLRYSRPVDRINALFCSHDGNSVISLADTGIVSISNKKSLHGSISILEPDRLTEGVVLGDLRPFQKQEIARRDTKNEIPYLHYRSMLRLPLFHTADGVLLLNCWSNEPEAFSMEDMDELGRTLEPIADELRNKFADLYLHGTTPQVIQKLQGQDKINLCPGLVHVSEIAKKAARADCPILVLGETGVGKEAVVDMIHELSARNKGPFIKVNCGAIPEGLLDSELFGHERGAFTGAVASRPGFFEMAEGGTLFLDEIGEMPLSVQVRLLRVLECDIVRRIGSSRFIPVNVRIIGATNSDLLKRVAEGSFRQDLWFRLSTFPVEIPPLRQRKGDIPHLVHYFVKSLSHKMGLPFVPKLGHGELNTLYNHEWPGNVRELEHVVERAMLDLSREDASQPLVFKISHVPQPIALNQSEDKCDTAPKARDEHQDLEEGWPTLRELEDRYIRKVLQHCGGKLTGSNSATTILDIHYTTLKARMNKMHKSEH